MAGSILGSAVRRVEDPDLLVGRGTFVDNLRRAGTLHAVFVRSPFAHARITSVDTSEAERAAGVVGVLTGRDVADRAVPTFGSANENLKRTALATDKVRFVGEPVALVVAETRAQAVDAAELVDVDYDDLPAVADMEAALAGGAPLQFEELGSNIAKSRIDRAREDPLTGADHVVRLRLENHRVAVAPIEGHAILVEPTESSLTCWVSTQHPHDSRDLICDYTGLPSESVRVVAPHVGGAFGGKAGIVAEHAAVIAAARRLGRAVTWMETRSEAMLSMHGRGQVQYSEIGLTAEGRIVGLRLRMIGDCGAYAGFGGGFPLGPTRLMAQGTYVVPRMQYDALAVLTNTSPVGAFRGAGRPEAAAMIERLMDAAAAELGLPPEELRRRNFIQPDAFPFTTHSKVKYDNGDYDLPLREALRIADVDAARAEQQRRREAGDRTQLGIGIAPTLLLRPRVVTNSTGISHQVACHCHDQRQRIHSTISLTLFEVAIGLCHLVGHVGKADDRLIACLSECVECRCFHFDGEKTLRFH
jgi:carbon-monoxide dehydrogenase large subunit